MSDPAPRRAERRRATVLFADLIGFTALSAAIGPERAYLITTECMRRLDAAARRHGGAVDKYLGDCLMAVFGYPVPLARDARAALDAALEMRRLVRDYVRDLRLEPPLDVHVGVNSGWLVAGDVRGGAIREFHVLGDCVNIAARLKQRAPAGCIYVGELAAEETRAEFEYAPLEPLALKGKELPVATFELVAARGGEGVEARDASGPVAPLVGRGAELRQLELALGRLRDGRGGSVAIVGPSGSGSSRLLAELRAAARTAGIGWIDAASPTASAAVDARDEREPLVIALDDLDRADPAALETLDARLDLATRAPVLLAVALRADAGPAALRLLAHMRESHGASQLSLELAPLGGDAALELIEALPGSPLPSAESRALVIERAGGNPRKLILGAYLAPALEVEAQRERASGARGGDTERRRATVLFADITGFTRLTERLGDESAYGIVADALALLDGVARRYGGHVDKYLGDCVMASFGVPTAIEDAPRAAVNAAIEMRERMRAFNRERALDPPLDVHSGINTGLAIAGEVSGPLLREYALLGEPVDVADRLKDQAPAGEVRVGQETWRLTNAVFEYRPTDGVSLPGHSSELPGYQLVSDRVQLHRRAAGAGELFRSFVGREPELARLRELVAQLASGRGAIVSVRGEAGLGKSRLVAELRSTPEANAASWLVGRSLSVGAGLGFHPFADLLRAWAGITDDDAEETAPQKLFAALEGVFGAEAPQVQPFLAALMGLAQSPADAERLRSVPGEALPSVLRAHVTELVRRLSAQRPLALVFDDLHWADLSSVELLESLLRLSASVPLLVVCVYRPGFAETSERLRGVARAQHAERYVEVEIGPLAAAAARDLIDTLDVPIEVRLALVQRSGGNPLFIDQVVRSLIEEGAVEWSAGAFRATDQIRAAAIPASVGEVILARVDHLAPRQKQLLRMASVIGGIFHVELVADLLGDAAEVRAALVALEVLDLVVPWDRQQGAEYAFRHPLVQEVVYEGLLESARRELHERVGRTIEASFSESFPGYAAMLAFHYGRAGDPVRAEPWLLRAGEAAARSVASNEALQFFREASRLYLELHGDAGDPRKRARLERNVAVALANRGRMEEAWDHFDLALARMGHRPRRSAAARRVGQALDALWVLARLYLPLLGRARRAATERDREIAELLFRRALIQGTGQPARFLADSTSALRWFLARDPSSFPDTARMYAGAAALFSVTGLSFGISARFLRLAESARANGAPSDIFVRYISFLHHFLSGDWSAAHEIEETALEQGLREGRLQEVLQYSLFLIEKQLRQGRSDELARAIARIARIWATYEYAPARFAPTLFRMQIAGERRADDAVDACEAYARETDQPALQILAAGYRAEAQTLRGELDAAAETLAEGERRLLTRGRPGPYPMSGFAYARFLHDVARLEAALERGTGQARDRDELQRAARASGRTALRIAARVAFRRPAVLRIQGRRAWLVGRRPEALSWWKRSLAAADALGMIGERARACAEIGLHLAGSDGSLDGRPAADWLGESRRAFEALSLGADLTCLESGRVL